MELLWALAVKAPSLSHRVPLCVRFPAPNPHWRMKPRRGGFIARGREAAPTANHITDTSIFPWTLQGDKYACTDSHWAPSSPLSLCCKNCFLNFSDPWWFQMQQSSTVEMRAVLPSLTWCKISKAVTGMLPGFSPSKTPKNPSYTHFHHLLPVALTRLFFQGPVGSKSLSYHLTIHCIFNTFFFWLRHLKGILVKHVITPLCSEQ